MVEEIKEIVDIYRMKNIEFLDDMFTMFMLDRERAARIADEI